MNTHDVTNSATNSAIPSSSPTPREDLLVWLDLEMTGLHPERDFIIEIATIITDNQLNIIAEGPNIAVYQPPEILSLMDEWNQKTHGASGLIERVQTSSFSTAQAEALTLDFLKCYVAPGTSPLCGNTICQDRRFLYQHMPLLEQFLHYRLIDVSTIKELSKRWYGEALPVFVSESKHEALNDVKESIAECRYYREKVFVAQFPQD